MDEQKIDKQEEGGKPETQLQESTQKETQPQESTQKETQPQASTQKETQPQVSTQKETQPQESTPPEETKKTPTPPPLPQEIATNTEALQAQLAKLQERLQVRLNTIEQQREKETRAQALEKVIAPLAFT